MVFITACTSSQWRCSNGQCISSYQRCDGDRECTDGSDELNCCKQCANLKVPLFESMRCILHRTESSSSSADSSCSGWACSNGQCISSYQRCNGYRECSDGSDELSCGTCEYLMVSFYHFVRFLERMKCIASLR